VSTVTRSIELLLRAAEPAVLLVTSRLLRRIIKYDRGLTGFGLRVPHCKSYVIEREKLLAFVDRGELGIAKDRELPETVILLPELEGDDDAVASENLRLLLHTRVHRAFARVVLSVADIRSRVHRIGQVAFDEIRTVLRQEKLLLPPRDDRTVYEEFAAVYLEFKHFVPELLPVWFPAIDDWNDVDTMVAQDVDGEALLRGLTDIDSTKDGGIRSSSAGFAGEVLGARGISCRSKELSPSSPLPQSRERGELAISPPSDGWAVGSYVTANKLAERAAAKGNAVRAALEWSRSGQPARAADELQHLVVRLHAALELPPSQSEVLNITLPALLLAESNHGGWPAELRLLFDLQNVCLDFERPVASPDLTEWIYSSFRKPFVRELPFQPLVQAVKHLRRVNGRLLNLRIDANARHELSEFLEASLQSAEARLREKLRPVVYQALTSVGLRPGNYPERIAQSKVVEELLDNIVDHGYLRIGDLRDAVSRSQLKLPDLSGPHEWLTGDALLRANRALAVQTPGIYRRGEIYLRWLQRGSAAMFGTVTGRLITLHLLLPFGGAFLAVEGPFQIVHEFKNIVGSIARFVTGVEHPPHVHSPFPLAPWPLILCGGVIFWLLLHVAVFRAAASSAVGLIGRTLRAMLIDAPVALLRWPLLRRLVFSQPCRWFWQLIVKPAVPAALVWWSLPACGVGQNGTTLAAAAMFAVVLLLANSRLGRDAEEVASDWLARRWRLIRDFIPGLFRLIIDAFKQLMEWLDRGLYAVDEWLRFRQGESRLTLIWKTVAGTVWSLFAYVVRFVLVLFVEPQLNPIKHVPVVTISHKLLLPMIPAMTGLLMERFAWNKKEAVIVATIIIGKIPGVFGFLVWELKENWRLYCANRPLTLRPVVVGHHGETVPLLLRPGLHSGTLPNLFAKLRRAEQRHDSRRLQRFRDALRQNEEAVRHFVERELAAYLNLSTAWPYGPVAVASVRLATNRIRIELICLERGDRRAVLTLEEQSGWLLAGILDPGWVDEITPEAGKIIWMTSKGFCKTAGVDLLREQIGSVLSPPGTPYDVANGKLLVWPDEGFATEIWYDLNEWPRMHPLPVELTGEFPTLDADSIEFRRKPIAWHDWVAAWTESTTK
jgi:hypothetical protein